jgi:hypothetical protein
MLRTGEKVVCIADGWSYVAGSLIPDSMRSEPLKNNIYCIKMTHWYEGRLFLEFSEFGNDVFCAEKFRRLDYDFVADVIRMVTDETVTIS